MIKEMKPGDIVYHINRDEYGYPVEASGTVYLAEIADYIVSVAEPVGCCCIEELMEHLADMTREDFNDDIYVHPICDCYETYSEAEKAREESTTAWESEEESE
jgi:hypothetical protein